MKSHDEKVPATRDWRTKYMYATAGAFSSCVTTVVCHPLEVIKVRLQFGVFELIKAYAESINPGTTKRFTTVFCASSTASTSATLVTFPFHLLRTRLIAQGNDNQVYTGLFKALLDIYHTDGARGFYKGLTPALVQTVPMAGTSFSIFALLKDLITVIREEDRNLTVTEGLLAGGLAGLVSKSTLYPLDLTVKRMQMQGFLDVRKGYGKAFVCTGLINCIQETIRIETFFGLYKGLVPSLAKSVAVSGLTFAIYEQVTSFLPSLF